LTQNAIHANVVGAVADSCFHETADAESHFTGACVVLFYRVMLLDAEPTGFAAAGCAIAEAFGFYRAGQINAARDTLLFALPIMELIEPRTDWQRAAIAATYVFRTGLAAKTAEDLEMVEKLMQLAARLFEPKGNDYARCLYYLSEAAGKSGRLGEQLRLLKRILEVPNIRDDELLQIARTGVSVCRAELEGRPELFDLGDNDARGIPKDLALLSKEFAVKAMSGINTTSEEERRYAQALIDWSKYCETQGNRAGTFWAAVTLLRVALSHGSANFPMSYRNILSLADRYESHGDAADRMQYESLKAVAEEAIQAECAALSSHESFTIGGLTQSLRDIRSRK
jgi:hypothetical protein